MALAAVVTEPHVQHKRIRLVLVRLLNSGRLITAQSLQTGQILADVEPADLHHGQDRGGLG